MCLQLCSFCVLASIGMDFAECSLHFSVCEFGSDWMVFRSFKQIYDVMVLALETT